MPLKNMDRKKTESVTVGNNKIGGGSRITVQTMWKKSLHNLSEQDINEIRTIENLGCDIIRFSVPDIKSAGILKELKKHINMPLVADIHFDYRIALECIGFGIDKIRINPGNIGASWKVEEVLKSAADKNVPIRIGINSGSMPRKLSDMDDKAEAMLKAADDEIEILEKNRFGNAVFSLKSSNAEATIRANRKFSLKYNYPLHLGITEAGPLTAGLVKSSIALSKLLDEGIGDTLRVSLSDTPANEVIAGREILRACGLSEYGVNIISCPRCGRSTFDTHKFLESIFDELYLIKEPLNIAVMGCVVNGPGEASEADIGITGIGNKIVIFKHGKIFTKIDENKGREEFLKLLKSFQS